MVRRSSSINRSGSWHEQAREVRAHHPATTQFTRRPVEIALAKCKAGENFLRLRLDLPAAQLIVTRVEIVVRIDVIRMRSVPCLILRRSSMKSV